MRKWILLLTWIGCTFSAVAQLDTKLYRSETKIDSLDQGKWLVELDNITFFKDNEYAGRLQKGYTLPGFWLQPKLVYYPLSNVKLELGAHLLRYWGADRYPDGTYQGIADLNSPTYQKGFHALPWLRAQVDLGNWSLVFGDIYGKSNHRLVDPLYNSELNLTADPEAGLQVLYSSVHFDMDVWVDWQSFIFRDDTHQERFQVGFSSRFKWNSEESPFHAYLPLQVMAQHRGGEIDTIHVNSVQTLMNGAAGLGFVWNTEKLVLRRVGAEADFVFSYQQAGHLWPVESGTGYYLKAYADLKDFRVKAAWWRNYSFVSLQGNPFYSYLSVDEPGTQFRSTGMFCLGLEYARNLGHGIILGADADIYLHKPFEKLVSGEGWEHKSFSNSFSIGAYLRVNPSILIRHFGKE